MYCENCHKENPDNFNTCIYCGTSLQPSKKAGFLKSRNSLRDRVTPIGIFSAFAVIAVIITAVFSVKILGGREHPESVAGAYALCVASKDTQGYLLLLDDEYKDFLVSYKYYTDEELSAAVSSELTEKFSFYNEKCGEGFVIKCEAVNISFADEKQLADVNEYLSENFMYKTKAENAAEMRAVFNVKGKLGEYTTVIDDFICIKTDEVWYYAPEIPDTLNW